MLNGKKIMELMKLIIPKHLIPKIVNPVVALFFSGSLWNEKELSIQ